MYGHLARVREHIFYGHLKFEFTSYNIQKIKMSTIIKEEIDTKPESIEVKDNKNSTAKPKKKPKIKSAIQIKNEALRKENKDLKTKLRILTKENALMRNAMRLFYNMFRTFNTKEFTTAMKIVNKINLTNNIVKGSS